MFKIDERQVIKMAGKLNNTVKNVIALRQAVDTNFDGYTTIVKKVSTGSYVYTVYAIYSVQTGIYYRVHKKKKTGENIGDVFIHTYSTCGFEYDNTAIGSLPDSVSKAIRQFTEAMYTHWDTKQKENR